MRTFKVRPLAVGLAISCFAVLATAYVGATFYLVYRDDLLGGAVTRQVEMQYAYEARLAALRAELDRLSSRHMVQTAGVESQVAALLDRQESLLERQSALDGLVEKARGAGLTVAAEAPRLPRARPVEEAPSTLLSYAPSLPAADHMITGSLIKADSAETRGMLKQVSAELEESDGRQAAALQALGAAAEAASERLDAVLSPLGLRGPAGDEPQGGPFIPLAGLHFVERVAIVDRMLDDLAALRDSAAALPLGQPVAATRISSRFGSRKDPFLNQQGFHAGIDFAAGPGTPVRTTAAGTVVAAGWEGGYGHMVEVRHSGGISTRYGHLSAILVKAGDRVEAGDPIGRVGSTGRSTGPHLHYETRRGGRAVDPSPYLAAGNVLRKGFCQHPPRGCARPAPLGLRMTQVSGCRRAARYGDRSGRFRDPAPSKNRGFRGVVRDESALISIGRRSAFPKIPRCRTAPNIRLIENEDSSEPIRMGRARAPVRPSPKTGT